MEVVARVEHPRAAARVVSSNDVLVWLEAPPSTDGRRPPLNLSLVLDQSGSMAGAKLLAVKAAARRLVEQLRPDDYLSLVTYDSDVHLRVPQGPLDRPLLLRQIEALAPGSSTNLSGGWLEGLSQLDEVRDELPEDAVHRVLLLTDGQANEGVVNVDQLVAIAREFRKRSLGTTTLGFGDDFHAPALQRIAEEGGGRFYYAPDGDGIAAAFLEEFGELATLIGQNLEVRISTAPGVQVSNWLSEFPGQRLGTAIRARLGDVYADDRKQLLFTLELPAVDTSGPREVAWVDVRYVGVRGAHIGPMRAQTAVVVEFDDAPAVEPDQQVAREVLLARAAQAKRRAAALIEDGHGAAARSMIDGAVEAIDAADSGVREALEAERSSLARYRGVLQEAEGAVHGGTAKALRAEAYEQRESRGEYRGPRPRTLTCELAPAAPERMLDLLAEGIEALRALGHDEAFVQKVRYVVDELAANALEHGAVGVEAPRTTVELRVSAGYALVRVTDNGPGFEPQATMTANRQAEEAGVLGSRGRGLISVARGVDALNFNQRGNQVTALLRPLGAGATRRSGSGGGRFHVEYLGDVAVVDVGGYLDAYTYRKLESELATCLAAETPQIVCDLRALRYISSAGAGALIAARQRAVAAGGEMLLARPPDNILEVLELLGLTRVMTVCQTLDEAVKRFGW